LTEDVERGNCSNNIVEVPLQTLEKNSV